MKIAMSDSYSRVKKWRASHKTKKILNDQTHPDDNKQSLSDKTIINGVSEDNDFGVTEPCGLQINNNIFEGNDCGVSDSSSDSDSDIGSYSIETNENDEGQSSDSSYNSLFQENNEEVVSKKTLREKLRCWSLDNMNVLTLNVVTQMLTILQEEGHEDLPKTAQQLLKTKHCRPMKSVLSKRETTSSYIYFGIKNILEKIIFPDVYTEKTISVQLHIDGISIYNNSLIQVWPIALKVYNQNYESKPVVVALYCGDSKPYSAKDYLKNLVKEANEYISHGIILNEIKYSFKIFCIIADSPARAFIKSIKHPGGFFACERCDVEGITKNHKRVNPNMDCNLRTKETFKDKVQPEHHPENVKTKLSKLKQFDPVHDVALDSMHLLYLGVMKSLLEKLIVVKKHTARLKKCKVEILKKRIKLISEDIPIEFERKLYDIDQVSKWKATQFRFFLLYIGPFAFKNVLSENKYHHFLLLYVACRILNNDSNAIKYADYAQDLLRKFFKLLPSEYGEDAQVLNMHNLIHVADDVRHLQVPLSEVSAFWGENFISIFKHLVKSPYKPLTQIANRLEVLQSSDYVKIKKNHLCECTYGSIRDVIDFNQK